MKQAIRVVLSLLPLLVLGISSDRADATPTQCRQIRQVRRLAIQQGLDDENLATLEAQYCDTAQPSAVETIPPPTASQECLDLTIMTRLARLSDGNSNLVRLVESQQQFACGLADTWGRAIIEYPNGQRAKIGDNWQYPNGKTAKFGAIWNYPNGQTAKIASRWYYPNGEIAKFGTRWSYPTGQSVNFENLVTWACSMINRGECASRLLALRNTNDFWSEMATLELAWQAYSQSIVGAGLGTKFRYSPITEKQNPPDLTDNCSTKPALILPFNQWFKPPGVERFLREAIAPEVDKSAPTTSRQGITDFYTDVPDRSLVRLS